MSPSPVGSGSVVSAAPPGARASLIRPAAVRAGTAPRDAPACAAARLGEERRREGSERSPEPAAAASNCGDITGDIMGRVAPWAGDLAAEAATGSGARGGAGRELAMLVRSRASDMMLSSAASGLPAPHALRCCLCWGPSAAGGTSRRLRLAGESCGSACRGASPPFCARWPAPPPLRWERACVGLLRYTSAAARNDVVPGAAGAGPASGESLALPLGALEEPVSIILPAIHSSRRTVFPFPRSTPVLGPGRCLEMNRLLPPRGSAQVLGLGAMKMPTSTPLPPAASGLCRSG
mmetsp:Transcript_19718/g.48413  ORF Transcript_19718/g.48413 Transcript_19718/m.48413 type:complete len:293 (-) Transcript_19718:84-962(-)